MEKAIERTKVLLSNWCCDELKEAAQNWLDSIGTDKEKEAGKNMFLNFRIQSWLLTECLHFCRLMKLK